jgi:hypothetical protein
VTPPSSEYQIEVPAILVPLTVTSPKASMGETVTCVGAGTVKVTGARTTGALERTVSSSPATVTDVLAIIDIVVEPVGRLILPSQAPVPLFTNRVYVKPPSRVYQIEVEALRDPETVTTP